jgi:hypothetical protein
MNDMKSFLPFLSTTGQVDISIPQVGYDYPNVVRKNEKQKEKRTKNKFNPGRHPDLDKFLP